MTIASIDFETANYSRASMCSAGVVIFIQGILVESLYWTIKPPEGHDDFLDRFTEIHLITKDHVAEAPHFSAIADEFLAKVACVDLVIAHNAPFDMSVLRATLEHFNLPCPEFRYLCTCRFARRVWPELPNHRLSTLAEHIKHPFEHHHAQADAEAAGRVFHAMLRHQNIHDLSSLIEDEAGTLKLFEPRAP